MTELLDIRDLRISFRTARGVAEVVNGFNLSLGEGQVHGLVGESGSGKSVTSRAVLGILPHTAVHSISGSIRYKGRELLEATDHQMGKEVRGREISMIFQDPMTALNPVMKVGTQIAQPLGWHLGLRGAKAAARALDLLEQVGIPDPRRALRSYPTQLSGGQRQRIMIAIALACDPKLLIADEPTTALDVTIQAQILDLLVRLQKEHGMALVLITHDMGVVAETAERVQVQYAGQKVEEQPVKELFRDPHHPYTAALLSSLPERATVGGRLPSIPGVVPGQHDRPTGCLFSPRCSFATDLCRRSVTLQPPSLGSALCNYPLVGGVPQNHPGKTAAPAEERA